MSVSTAAATTRRDLTFVAILALFALEPTLGFLTSNIANIIVAYDIGPGEATWVITAASLVMIPVALLCVAWHCFFLQSLLTIKPELAVCLLT